MGRVIGMLLLAVNRTHDRTPRVHLQVHRPVSTALLPVSPCNAEHQTTFVGDVEGPVRIQEQNRTDHYCTALALFPVSQLRNFKRNRNEFCNQRIIVAHGVSWSVRQ